MSLGRALTSRLAAAEAWEGEEARPDKIVQLAHVEPVAALAEYRPWGQEMPQVEDTLELRWRNGNWKLLYRPYIVSIDGTGDTLVSLIGTFGAVTIQGQKLGALRSLLKGGQIDYLEEFDPKRWPARKEGEPIIEQIQILGMDGREE